MASIGGFVSQFDWFDGDIITVSNQLYLFTLSTGYCWAVKIENPKHSFDVLFIFSEF